MIPAAGPSRSGRTRSALDGFLPSSGFAGLDPLLAAAGTTPPFLLSPLSLAGGFAGSAGFDGGELFAGGCAPSARLRPSETTKGAEARLRIIPFAAGAARRSVRSFTDCVCMAGLQRHMKGRPLAVATTAWLGILA